MLNFGLEAPTGLLHHLSVYGDALLLDGGNERCLGGMRASVSLILQNAPKEIIHWVQIWATGRPFVLGYEVVAVLLQPGEGVFGDMTRCTVLLPYPGAVLCHLLTLLFRVTFTLLSPNKLTVIFKKFLDLDYI